MALNRNLMVTLLDRGCASIEASLVPRLPAPAARTPVFLIGCGRSGTTILGECVARHPGVTYLHEPRVLWASAYPVTDIWTRNAQRRRGKLMLDAADASPQRSKDLQKLFGFRLWRTGGSVLVEKHPINAFRLPFLDAVFPDARYLHISRDGREVARSIRKRADNPRNGWYGADDYKWRQLAAAARRLDICSNRDLDGFDNYQRGLLEWRLSMDAYHRFKTGAAPDRVREISYNQLIDQPSRTLAEAFEFFGLPPHPRVDRYVAARVQRRSQRIDSDAYTEDERSILGGTLCSAAGR